MEGKDETLNEKRVGGERRAKQKGVHAKNKVRKKGKEGKNESSNGERKKPEEKGVMSTKT